MAKLVILGLGFALASLMVTFASGACPVTGEAEMEVNFVADYPTYSEPKRVERYSKNEFETTQDYFMSTAMSTAVPVLAFGAICWIIIFYMICCRCCCHRCHLKDPSEGTTRALLAIVCGLLFASFIMVIVGLSNDKEQSDALTAVPATVAIFMGILDEVATEINPIQA
jgi:hypothetical protein